VASRIEGRIPVRTPARGGPEENDAKTVMSPSPPPFSPSRTARLTDVVVVYISSSLGLAVVVKTRPCLTPPLLSWLRGRQKWGEGTGRWGGHAVKTHLPSCPLFPPLRLSSATAPRYPCRCDTSLPRYLCSRNRHFCRMVPEPRHAVPCKIHVLPIVSSPPVASSWRARFGIWMLKGGHEEGNCDGTCLPRVIRLYLREDDRGRILWSQNKSFGVQQVKATP